MNIIQRNNVNVKGKGEQTLLFAHGLNCDQNSYKYITGAFEDDYQLVLFDFIGSGKSDFSSYDAEKYSTLQGYTDDIIEICDELKLKNVIFIGHSVSCMMGVLASIQRPELFSKLILIGPSPRYINEEGYIGGFDQEDIDGLFEIMEENYIDWSKNMAPSIMGNPDKPSLGLELGNSLCNTDPTIGKAFARVTFLSDNRTDLSRVKVDSLTLQCKDDIIAPLEVGHFIHQHTPGNMLKILEATGHCPHMSAPEKTIEAILDFIR